MLVVLVFGAKLHAQAPLTFNNQVVRIFQQHCQICHRPGNIAPFPLLTYIDALSHSGQILRAVSSREMPPWKPADAHGVFQGERALSDQEIQIITAWAANGAPEGNLADLPEPVSFPPEWTSGQPDVIVQSPQPFTIPTGSADIYRCFVMPAAPADQYVRGYEVLPGNRAIVHHVLIFTDDSGQSVSLDNADPGPGYDCFGGAGFFLGLGGIGGWAPGASAESFPLGTGVRIRAGSRVVMQVHYSLQSVNPGDRIDPDQTRIGLYLSPTPLQQITFTPVVNLFFAIPPGDSHYQVRASTTITSDSELVAIAPHMHLLGREATVEAKFPNGTRQTLIRIDNWDFHWQGMYDFVKPVLLPAGTVVELTAYYDNSTGNPNNPTNPPVTVRWGERTVDEMCLTFLAVKTPGAPPLNTVPFSLSDRGLTSFSTRGTAPSVQAGYARVSATAGIAPAGVAVLDYVQNGILISEAGIPSSPLLTQGRLYAQSGSGIRSGLAIANPNSDPAVITFSYVDSSGQDAGSASTTIQPNSQIAAFLDDAVFGGKSPFTGSMTFTSNLPISAVALRGRTNERNEFLITTLPVANLAAAPSTLSGIFPHFADGGGWSTELLLVNPTDAAINGNVQFISPSGQPVFVSINNQSGGNFTYSIPARSARSFITSGVGPDTRAGSVVVVPSRGSVLPTGTLVFALRRSDVVVSEAGVALAAAGSKFRVYVEATEGFGTGAVGSMQSGLAIANPTSIDVAVRLELVNPSGASVAVTTITLPPESQIAKFLSDAPGFENVSLPFQGMLRVTSSAPIAVTGLRARYNERNDFLMTTTPPVPEDSATGAEIFFPQFADAGGYSTQFVLFSSGGDQSLSGTVRFVSPGGDPVSLKLR